MPKEITYIIYGDGNCVGNQLPEDAHEYLHAIEALEEKNRQLEEDLNWAMGQIVIRDAIIKALKKNDK